MSDFENVLVVREGHLAVVTVNRPAKLNALDNATIGELHVAFDELDRDGSVGAIVLTGAENAIIPVPHCRKCRVSPRTRFETQSIPPK